MLTILRSKTDPMPDLWHPPKGCFWFRSATDPATLRPCPSSTGKSEPISKGHLKKGSVEEQLFQQIDCQRIPRHVAIIMDGNGRWAQKRRLPRVAGHRAGIHSVRETVETAARLKMQVLTLYAFSVENWKRPAGEVATLMRLFKEFLKKELKPY